MSSNFVRRGISRRGFLSGLTAGAGGAALAACTPVAQEGGEDAASISEPEWGTATVTFDGEHQAGIATPEQANLNLVAFNVRDGMDRAAVRRLMRVWTEDARTLTQGGAPLGSLEPELADTPANLTITCGFGPRLFELIDAVDQRPEWLAPLPEFSRDQLEERWGQSDLVLQICADDPLTVSYATRHMIRSGVDYVQTGWVQQGFLDAHGTQPREETPRNLFGQKDGTENLATKPELDEHVWINEGPGWAHGGTAMVVRRVFLNMDTWEILDRNSREVAMGRDLAEGAPLSGADEFDEPDFAATDHTGLPVIDPASHIARARAPETNPEQVIRRRPFNYDLPPDPELSQAMETEGVPVLSNSGQVFICFQRDPLRQFVPIQQRLDEMDRLNQWISHIGSAVYVLPPGVSRSEPGRDSYWGAALLGD